MVVPLIGYLDRFSGRPGERIAVKVSSQRHEPYDADLVRIIHGDANPAGPGLKINKIEPGFAGRYPSRFQPVHSGSCGVVTISAPIALPQSVHDCRAGTALAARRTAADGAVARTTRHHS